MKYIFLLPILSLIVLFIYHYPDVYAYMKTPPDRVFMGQNQFFDPWDINVYVGAIRFGQSGNITLPNLYTSIPNTPVHIYTFLTTIGFVFRTVSPFTLFQISNLFTGFLLIISIFFACLLMGVSRAKSLFVTALVSLGGGLGFLGGKISSADISDSSFTFYSTFQKPHEAVAVACYILSLVLIFKFVTGKKQAVIKILPIIILLLVTVFIYPYFVLSYLLIVGIFILFAFNLKDRFRKLIYAVTIIVPAIFTSYVMALQFIINPTFGNVGSNLSIGLLPVVTGFGVLVPVFLYFLFYLPKNKALIFLSIWFVVTFALAVLPIGPGKIFFRGSFFPIVLLCVICLDEIKKKLKGVDPAIFYAAFSALLLGTSIYIFLARMGNSDKQNTWVYINRSEYELFDALNKNTPSGTSVLTYYKLSNQIPALTHNRVYFGHLLQTPDALSKTGLAAQFIAGAGSVEAKNRFLKQNNISYIIWGDEEEKVYEANLSQGNKIKDALSQMKSIYKNPDFEIYSVKGI